MVSIRPACISDAGLMSSIYIASWASTYRGILPDTYLSAKLSCASEKIRKMVAADASGHYLILKEGTACGIFSAGPGDGSEFGCRCYELRGLYLHPAYQGCGLGRLAVKYVVDLGRASGSNLLSVWVLEANTGAVEFYSKCGFTADGGARDYEGHAGMRCIRMVAYI